MANDIKKARLGNVFVFLTAIVFVAVCVIGGIFYLLPGFVHPFTPDTPDLHYAHLTIAVGFFLAAVLGLIVMRLSRPPSGDGTLIS